jgi:hypothetical protein
LGTEEVRDRLCIQKPLKLPIDNQSLKGVWSKQPVIHDAILANFASNCLFFIIGEDMAVNSLSRVFGGPRRILLQFEHPSSQGLE